MVNPLQYFREVTTELRKVSWPSVEQTRNMTLLVVVVSLLVGIYIGGLDFIFQKALAVLITN